MISEVQRAIRRKRRILPTPPISDAPVFLTAISPRYFVQQTRTIDYKVMRKCDNMSSCLTRLTSVTVGQTNYDSTAYIVRQCRLAKAVLCTGKLVHK